MCTVNLFLLATNYVMTLAVCQMPRSLMYSLLECDNIIESRQGIGNGLFIITHPDSSNQLRSTIVATQVAVPLRVYEGTLMLL